MNWIQNVQIRLDLDLNKSTDFRSGQKWMQGTSTNATGYPAGSGSEFGAPLSTNRLSTNSQLIENSQLLTTGSLSLGNSHFFFKSTMFLFLSIMS